MNPDTAIRIWKSAYRIRQVELEIVKRYYPDPEDKSKSPMRTPVHLHIGQEVLAATVREVVGEAHAYSTHRSHAHYLAWGGSLDAMIAELYGKATGCAGGWGGSMHLVDQSVGFMGTSAVVGSSLSMAVGDAFAAKLDGSDRVTVAFVGDAVLETGQFWEAWQFARLHELRLLIVMEDNGLSTATPKESRQTHTGFYRDRFTSDVNATFYDDLHTSRRMVRWPTQWNIHTTRFYEHVGVERDSWRDVPELDTSDDALEVLTWELPDSYHRAVWKEQVKDEIQHAFAAAEQAPWPEVVA